MALIPAKCTSCGATLTVSPSEDAAVCPFCNTAFIIQKAINYYIQNNTIQAGVVNIYGGQSEFVIRGGRLERYNGSATEVSIPDSVITIGADAFEGCVNIREIIIPGSVKEIEGRSIGHYSAWGGGSVSALAECKRLERVEFLDGATLVPKQAFEGCKSAFTILLPRTITQIGYGAFSGCGGLKSLRLPDSIKIIPAAAFISCSKLADLVLPDSIELIDDHAFSYCESLTSLIIPSRTRIIGPFAFKDCKNVTNVKFNNQLEEIGVGAFTGCSSLEVVDIPQSVRKIGSCAFRKCSSLNSITGNNTATIGDGAFGDYWHKKRLCEHCGGKVNFLGTCKLCGKYYLL